MPRCGGSFNPDGDMLPLARALAGVRRMVVGAPFAVPPRGMGCCRGRGVFGLPWRALRVHGDVLKRAGRRFQGPAGLFHGHSRREDAREVGPFQGRRGTLAFRRPDDGKPGVLCRKRPAGPIPGEMTPDPHRHGRWPVSVCGIFRPALRVLSPGRSGARDAVDYPTCFWDRRGAQRHRPWARSGAPHILAIRFGATNPLGSAAMPGSRELEGVPDAGRLNRGRGPGRSKPSKRPRRHDETKLIAVIAATMSWAGKLGRGLPRMEAVTRHRPGGTPRFFCRGRKRSPYA